MKATHNPDTTTPTDVETTPAEHLRGAARYLQLHGWTQGRDFATDPTAELPFPPACAMGAISAAVAGNAGQWTVLDGELLTPFTHAMNTLADWLRWTDLSLDDDGLPIDRPTTFTDPYIVVGEWNDETGRTLGEVLTALNEAADHWDRRQRPGGGR